MNENQTMNDANFLTNPFQSIFEWKKYPTIARHSISQPIRRFFPQHLGYKIDKRFEITNNHFSIIGRFSGIILVLLTISMALTLFKNNLHYEQFMTFSPSNKIAAHIALEKPRKYTDYNSPYIPGSRFLSRYNSTISGNLYETAGIIGIPTVVINDVIRVFSYDVDFQRDIHPGDQVEILVEQFVDGNRHVRTGNLLFAALTLSGKKLTAYRFSDDSGKTGYFSVDGKNLRKDLLKTPVTGASMTSGFGMRADPIMGFSQLHKGVDFAVPPGTPVMAAGDGVVEYVGFNGAYGRYIRLHHNSQNATAYAHLSRFARNIELGQRVEQGQIIGYTGNSGRSTGPHLHYEVIVNDQQVNPMKIKSEAKSNLSGHELARFYQNVAGTRQEIALTPISSKVAMVSGGLNIVN